MQPIEEILQQAKSAIQTAADIRSLDNYRVQYLGKKGQLTEYLKTLGQLPPEERPAAGQKINAAKETIQTLIDERLAELKKTHVEKELDSDSIDVTLPGRSLGVGSIHPVIQTIEDLKKIFVKMGFIVMEGPEIVDDYHNFEALNIPALHPARGMLDTFYFADGKLLRTHMSTVEVRAMRDLSLPIRMVAMGRVYRRDFDLTHTPMFHQLECQVIDENVSFADLKGLLHDFLHEFFSPETRIRFRPSYFPFTEPSAEVDISCVSCKGKGCRICKQTGWLEILGCGLLHPNVLNEAGIDAERYRALAFGAGIDRLAMLKYQISDLRSLFENDLRFLKQF